MVIQPERGLHVASSEAAKRNANNSNDGHSTDTEVDGVCLRF